VSFFAFAVARGEVTTSAERSRDDRAPGLSRWPLRSLAVLCLYLAFGVVYTWPLLPRSADRIASDAYDPILNTSILWWNAKTVPFSQEWWNPPYFYPADNISAFTENLQGLTPFSTPTYWLTRNPLTTYNVACFLTWPVSAFTAFLLVRFITRREDAAFLSGLAFGFSPYRMAELGHIQMLSTYWIPLVLLGLHGYLEQRRARWLVLFAVAWLLQSLANGYMMLFGAVLVALWVLYFCSPRTTLRAGAAIVVTWVIASAPLVPIFLKYQAVHEHYGLRRSLEDPIGVSAPFTAWLEVSQEVRLWRHVLPAYKDQLFPGITTVLLVACAAILLTRRRSADSRPKAAKTLRLAVGTIALGALVLILGTLLIGPWRIEIGGHVIRMSRLGRPLLVLAASSLVWLIMTDALVNAWRRRSPLLFYGVATVAMGLFACGKVLRAGERVLVNPAPYAWLLSLPGFTGLRVPTRFWMLGVLCLSVAAGLAFVRLSSIWRVSRGRFFALVLVGVVADGWIVSLPLAIPPEPWPRVERRDQSQPILELPLGPEWDAAGTFRSIWHRRRVVNGVSGYDPSFYAPLQFGLNDYDPEMLRALASLGSYDIVVNGAADPNGRWARYAESVAGSGPIASDGVRRTFRLSAVPSMDAAVGAAVPIASARAYVRDGAPMIDKRIETEWGDGPQHPGQWVLVDLGSTHEVGGVTHALGEYARDFPRHLAIDVSIDGASWEQVWDGPTAALAFLAAVRGPREASMHFSFPARQARYVRLRQLARHENLWRVSELTIHEPVRP
jgi:F5/8 type C domain